MIEMIKFQLLIKSNRLTDSFMNQLIKMRKMHRPKLKDLLASVQKTSRSSELVAAA